MTWILEAHAIPLLTDGEYALQLTWEWVDELAEAVGSVEFERRVFEIASHQRRPRVGRARLRAALDRDGRPGSAQFLEMYRSVSQARKEHLP